MDYLTSLWAKWLPPGSNRVAVDSRPRLSGILDTINSTLAHGPQTRLPSEFYDPKARLIADKIATEEWFVGYEEDKEYRKLGIGGLMGDIVDRMVSTAAEGGWRPQTNTPNATVKFALSGCHDTTIASILASLGTFDGLWPPYTSSVAVELFKDVEPGHNRQAGDVLEELSNPSAQRSSTNRESSFFSFLKRRASKAVTKPSPPSETARAPLSSLPPLTNHYVRIRYNDKPVRIPGCAAEPEKHLPGDDTFCTLEAFKEIVDKFTPANWREECTWNSGKGIFEEGGIPAGF